MDAARIGKLRIGRLAGLLKGDHRSAQAARFLVVGVINTVFSYSLFAVTTLLGAPALLALIVSTCLGVLFNFQTSSRLVFRTARNLGQGAGRGPPQRARVYRFVAMYACLLVANWLALSMLRNLGASTLAAQALLILPFAALSFLAQKLLVFRQIAPSDRLLRDNHAIGGSADGAVSGPLWLCALIIGAANAAFLVQMLAGPWLGVLACALLIASLWRLFGARPGFALGGVSRDDLRLWAFAGGLALVLCLLGGEGRVFYANTDWQIRDAVLADLSTHHWPVLYRPGGAEAFVMRAPLGMYILPALIGRVLGWKSAHLALLIQNTILLGAILAVFMSGARRWGGRLVIAGVIVAFSGWDLIGELVMGHFLRASPWADLFPSLETWENGLQYSSLITDLFWAPNHGLAGLAMAAAFVAWRRGRVSVSKLAALTGLCMLWSPLAVIGAAPFVVLAGFTELRSRRLAALSPATLAVLAAALAPIAVYLVMGGGEVEHGLNTGSYEFHRGFSLFILLEVAPLLYLAQTAWRSEQPGARTDFWLCATILVLIPFYRIGGSNDFMMRSSIFPIAILALMTAGGLLATTSRISSTRDGVRRLAVPIVALLIGAATPAAEFMRAVLEPVDPPRPTGLYDAWEQPASQGTSKATYVVPAAAYERARWLLRQPE